MARFCELSTPLGPELAFESMRVSEGLSRLFEIEIDALSAREDIEPRRILGHRVGVKVEYADGVKRHFDGFVTRFSHGSSVGRRFRYRLEVRPAMWFLTRTSDCRVFQSMSVPDIVTQVLQHGRVRGIEIINRLLDPSRYKKWEYCVQYRETDFNFVSRLLEQEGIAYFFEHEQGSHKLVLIDDRSKHQEVAGQASFEYRPVARVAVRDKDVVTAWQQTQEIQPAMYTLKDYDFLKPGSQQLVSRAVEHAHDHGQASAKYEMFDYPGEFDPVGGDALAEGDPYVASRVEEFGAQSIILRGEGPLRGFAAGARFKLTDHPRRDQNGEYLILSTEQYYEDIDAESMDGKGANYRCAFTALPQRQQYRPPRLAPKPLVHGLQSATVTGPSGEEIFTDEYGRIKVQFHWDRHGERDEKSSCFLRVSSLAAGNDWGFISIPRIGQEVLVSFLEGDPDRPVVTGVVYNGTHKPPWKLPENKTQWGMLSRSTKGGSKENANALRFEDAKGKEEVWLHAERNQRIEVEVDESHSVGHDRIKTIGNDETTHVKRDRMETVDRDEAIDIKRNRRESVAGNETLNVDGTRDRKVGKEESVNIGASMKIDVGTSYTLTAGTEIKLTTGASSITLKNDGTIEIKGLNITIDGMNVTANASVRALIDSKAQLDLKGGVMAVLAAPLVMIN